MTTMSKYHLAESGQIYDTIQAGSLEEAMEEAAERFDPSPYKGDETCWVDIRVTDAETGESDYVTMTVHPTEPDCTSADHEWEEPIELVGGCKENPGVFGHGGGVRVHSVCRHCGTYRIEDTWAQRPDTGEQGLESVEYKPADERSRAWVERQEA